MQTVKAFRIADQMENVNKLIYMERKLKMKKVSKFQEHQKVSAQRRSKLANLLLIKKYSKANYLIIFLTLQM
jgi:hypothetical protein